jgi:hypothetical protein
MGGLEPAVASRDAVTVCLASVESKARREVVDGFWRCRLFEAGMNGGRGGPIGVVKLLRARGGCLGVIRIRAWKAAISPGELPNERRSWNT